MMIMWMREDNAKTRGYLVTAQLIMFVGLIFGIVIAIIIVAAGGAMVAGAAASDPNIEISGEAAGAGAGAIVIAVTPFAILFCLQFHYYSVAKQLKANMA